MSDFGSELKRWMQHRETGVRELSRKSGYSPSYVSQLRSGQRKPSSDAARDLDDALQAGGRLAALAPVALGSALAAQHAGEITDILAAVPDPGPAGPIQDDDYSRLIGALADWAAKMKRRDLLAILSAAATAAYASPDVGRSLPDVPEQAMLAVLGEGRADETVVSHMTAILDHLMRQEDVLGPRVVLGTVLAQYDVGRSLLAGNPPSGVRLQLLTLMANISRFTGWLLFDLGDFKGAAHYYGQARSAAHEADDDAMCSMVLANWSHLATWSGDPRLGVEHALGAVAWGQRAGSKLLVSYACDVGARAYAEVIRRSARGDRRSDHAQCMAYLDQARKELLEAPEGDPGACLAYFYDPGLHLATRTSCLLALDDPAPALSFAQQSLATISPAFVRNIALTRVSAARAYIQMGEVEAACTELSKAASQTRGNTSVRLAAAITGARRTLAPWKESRPVTALDDCLRACQVTA